MSPLNKPTIASRNIQDINVPRVTIEVDQDEAERLGAFAEDAITGDEAHQANGDLALD
jgi:hypothetical protein